MYSTRSAKNKIDFIPVSEIQHHTILGISYLNGPKEQIVEAGLVRGLVIIPSAPVIVRIQEDSAHRAAVLNADLAIIDSGLMVICWRLLTGEQLVRVSGLAYLKLLLADPRMRETGNLGWIMPSESARDINLAWLRQIGHQTVAADCYIAPEYPKSGRLEDRKLLDWLKQRQPKHLIIALGGGVQERLGWYLKQELNFRLGIHCVGAAIGFLSGEQTNIPQWADRFYLGWLFRCLRDPSRFIPRYVKASRLIPLLVRYQRKIPPLVQGRE